MYNKIRQKQTRLGIPLFFDQFYIAKRIEDIGMGLQILPEDFTVENIAQTIGSVT